MFLSISGTSRLILVNLVSYRLLSNCVIRFLAIIGLNLIAGTVAKYEGQDYEEGKKYTKNGTRWITHSAQLFLQIGSHVADIVIINQVCHSPVSSHIQCLLQPAFGILVIDVASFNKLTGWRYHTLLNVFLLMSQVGLVVFLGDWKDAVDNLEIDTDGAGWRGKGTGVDPPVCEIDQLGQVSVVDIGVCRKYDVIRAIVHLRRSVEAKRIEELINDFPLLGRDRWVIVVPVEHDAHGAGPNLHCSLFFRFREPSPAFFTAIILSQVHSVHLHIVSLAINRVLRLRMEVELGCRVLQSTAQFVPRVLRLEVIVRARASSSGVREVDLDHHAFVQDGCTDHVGVRCLQLGAVGLLEGIAVRVGAQVDWTLVTVVALPVALGLVVGPVGAVLEVGVGEGAAGGLDGVGGGQEKC